VQAGEATRGLNLFWTRDDSSCLGLRPLVGTKMSATPAALWEDPGVSELTIECPRCGVAATETYYGPCVSCRTQLRETLGGDAVESAPAEYEPKMNVTPNAVALKDD